jgi:predicted P-loop ATPase
MKIDVTQHLKQLELLGYQDSEPVFYREFPPYGSKANPIKFSLKYPPNILEDRNQTQGLYFVVNGYGQTDNKITHCKAFFCEWDDRPLPEQEIFWKRKGFLEPTFQVKTRKSIHCYWVLETPIPVQDWKVLQTCLLNELDADRTLKNPSRVLRVAGAWHLKVDAEPVQCQLINITEKKYSQAEIETTLAQYSPTKITTPKPIKSVQSASSDIPLSRCLPNRQRELITQGITSGSRNKQGYGLAKDLIATAQYLIQSGISFSEDAKSLFLDYCHRCDQTDWGDREWESIWSSAGKSAGDPPLTPEMIGNCLKKWAKENKTVVVKTSTPLKEPQGWDDKDGQNVVVETPTPSNEPAPYNRFFYGGTKPLKEHELLDLLRGLGDRLSFDELTSTILLDGRKLTIGKEIKFWFLETFGETAEKGDISDCLTLCAKKNSFNPVKRYLSSLTAPAIPIDNLAARYFGREEKIYSRMVEMWLISAIARALTPVDPSMYAEVSEDAIGTKVDYTLILQSDQGKYKSTFFDILGGRWFSDSVKDIESKDSLMIVHSAWIIELSELDRITSKKQAGSIKHWLTQKTDSYRKPYAAEVEQNLPRRCVFCGTVNPSRFLVDDENRRFWILPVAEDSNGIDINLLQTERDGIWRSAYRAYHIGGLIPLLSLLVKTEFSKIHDFFFLALLLMNPHQQWWPTDKEMTEIKRLNQNFQEIDAWEDEIAHWIKGREYVSSYEILSDLLNFEPNQIKKPEQMRVMRILTGLGWKKEARRDYIQDDGSKKTRNVRLNPLIENNSSSRVRPLVDKSWCNQGSTGNPY